MNNKIDFLLEILINERNNHENIKIPKSYGEKRRLLRALMNIRPPNPISDEFIKVQNSFLRFEIESRGIAKLSEIQECPNIENVSLWKGDIALLKVDAIVNAANSQMLGCFLPNHHCIDNAIHSYAGIQLRNECNDLMLKQGNLEPIGSVKITKAYNLPSKYILHTVGPKIDDKLSKKDCERLENSYESCFNLANMKNLKSLAFCSISTGEFGFPKLKAAKIAISTIMKLLNEDNSFERIIFNVFSEEDYEIYEKILKKYKKS